MVRISRACCWQTLADGRLVLEDQAAHLAAEVVLDALEQHVARLVGGEAGDAVQGVELIGQGLLDLGVAAAQLFLLVGELALEGLEVVLLPVDQVELLVEQVGPLLQPLLLLAEVAAHGVGLGVELLAAAEGSSLAARSAWRPMVSASRRASAMICSASPRAD